MTKIVDAIFGEALAGVSSGRARRRTYARQFKSQVIAQCLEPGASVSAIALNHGINANVIRKWLPGKAPEAIRASATMVPVTIAAGGPAAMGRLRAPIELTLRGATLRIPGGFDAQELRSIVQILAELG